MCGRFTLRLPQAFTAFPWLDPSLLANTPPRFNIGPGQTLLWWPSEKGASTEARQGLWGWPSPQKGSSGLLINARAETLRQKPTFRPHLENRILIPADGYYEWLRSEGPPRPWYIHLPDDEPFFLAGLAAGDKALVLTTAAAGPAARIHHRIPWLLRAPEARQWLHREIPYPPSETSPPPPPAARDLQLREVHPRVNNYRSEGPACLDPPEPGPDQLTFGW